MPENVALQRISRIVPNDSFITVTSLAASLRIVHAGIEWMISLLCCQFPRNDYSS